MKRNVFVLSVVLYILIASSTFVSASEAINVKDYIKDKLPSIFSFYLSCIEDLDIYEKEFIDLLEKLPEKEQEYYAKEVYRNGFSLELLDKVKKVEEVGVVQPSAQVEPLTTQSVPTGKYLINWLPAQVNGWKNPLGEGEKLITSHSYDYNSSIYSDYWGKKHTGIDIDSEEDNNVYSITSGIVVGLIRDKSNPMRTVIIIKHTNSDRENFLAIYGHVYARDDLELNLNIRAGEKIGAIITAGTGPHLHFGINISSKFLNNFLAGNYGWGLIPVSDDPSDYGWVDPIEFLKENKPYKKEEKHEMKNLAVAIVMDRSGSMSGEKLTKERQAAEGFIASLRQDDYVCLITFAADANTEIELLQATPENKSKLQVAAGSVGAGGNTNIGAGLVHGLQQLARAGDSTSKKTLLMSDGMHNTGELWPAVEEYEIRGLPIHTVAYGQDADQKTLEEIAMRTGGMFFPADFYTITQIYQRISAHAHNQSVLFAYNDMISQGKQLNYQIPIDPDITSATFFVDWPGSEVEFSLQNPEGEIIAPKTFHNYPGVDYQKGETFCFYQVDEPKPGDWQATLFGKEIERGSEQVNLTVSGSSPLLANIFGLQPNYRKGEEIQIKVKILSLFDLEPEILREVKVTAEIKKPAPNLKKMLQKRVIDLGQFFQYALTKKKKLTLHDDGYHSDGRADDGIYGAVYKDTDENGHYVITVKCEAQKPDDEKIVRILKESIQVGPVEDRTVTLADFLGIKD